MIEVDTADYDTVVRVRNGDKALRFKLPARYCRHGVGERAIADVVRTINQCLKQLQEAE